MRLSMASRSFSSSVPPKIVPNSPFTGQIYDADIIFDDSMVRYFEQSAERLLPSAAMAQRMRDPALREFLERYPEWTRPQSGEFGDLYITLPGAARATG